MRLIKTFKNMKRKFIINKWGIIVPKRENDEGRPEVHPLIIYLIILIFIFGIGMEIYKVMSS